MGEAGSKHSVACCSDTLTVPSQHSSPLLHELERREAGSAVRLIAVRLVVGMCKAAAYVHPLHGIKKKCTQCLQVRFVMATTLAAYTEPCLP